MPDSIIRSLRVDVPLRLGQTMRLLELGSGDTAARFTDDHVRAAFRAITGPVSFRLDAASGQVDLEAWGPGASWLADHAAAFIGLTDDPDALEPRHEVVRQRHLRSKGLRIAASGAVYDSVVHWVVHQKVTGKGAARSMRDLVRVHGEPAPGPLGLRLGPAPEVVAGLGYEDFHPLGIERKRAEVLRNVARRVSRLEEIIEMSPAEASSRLQAFPGVGPWTAASVVGTVLGDPDAVQVGDYHIPNSVAWALAGEPRGTDERMLELLEPYRSQRRRVVLLLKGIHAPRYGARSEVRDIRGV
ncbi:MAG: DNA-3-methyladenine glycosylase 2 family protein [Acidimicrobiia bacterium]|nr:DNA-3-methyladenine glycosylase 2 family protein [Acidimicrobiia bacterium]NNC74882.1 DNA-3-methyladenine glycosylase 2 family protein [Acidimicrobiia bacterium]